jgi:hypothetical protein
MNLKHFAKRLFCIFLIYGTCAGQQLSKRMTNQDVIDIEQGSPRTDKLISASVQWAMAIMKKIDAVCRD